MATPPEPTASGAAVLSLLTFGEASGYELRSRADATLRFFFAAPAMSQIYAELDRLAAAGLVASREAQRPGSRPGRLWRLTAKGRRRLAAWAADEPVPPTVYRDHLALRLMLGALIEPDRLVEMVDEQRSRIEEDRAALQAVRAGLDPSDPAMAHPALVAEWGIATYDAELVALDQVRDRLPGVARTAAEEDEARAVERTAIDRLSMVYDADGGVVGELRYVVGHLLGRASCDLCDITHGGVRRKAAFDHLVATLPVPVDVVHRNEQDPDLATVTSGRAACVVAHTGAGLEVLVTRDELAACGGSVDRFAAVLRPRLAGRT